MDQENGKWSVHSLSVDYVAYPYFRTPLLARFAHNPHVVQASKKDFTVPTPNARTTFPQPLPSYLARNTPVPAATPTTRQPVSASAGRFSMGLKGMRKQLRRSGPRAELLVQEVETEMMAWLANSIWFNPDNNVRGHPGVPIGTSTAITEVSRSAAQLIWAIEDDAFARYVVHCCARYHNIVSFSTWIKYVFQVGYPTDNSL